MEKEHSFKRAPMTPEEFGKYLSQFISQLKSDLYYKELAFNVRLKANGIESHFEEMVKALNSEKTVGE